MMREIQITWIVQRHQMNVRVRHVNSNDGDTNLDTRTDLLEALGNLAAEAVQGDKELVILIENIVNLLFWNTQHMTLYNGVDIKESKTLVGLCNFITGDFTCDYT